MKTNQREIAELIKVLANEAELFTSYVDLLDQQKDAIVANDIDMLDCVTERQRESLTASRILDEKRTALVSSLQTQASVTGDLTITALLQLVSVEDGQRLSQLRDTIVSLNDSIEDGKQRNEYLIDKSRTVISETLRLFNRVGVKKSRGVAYTAGASAPTVHPDARISLALDRKA